MKLQPGQRPRYSFLNLPMEKTEVFGKQAGQLEVKMLQNIRNLKQPLTQKGKNRAEKSQEKN